MTRRRRSVTSQSAPIATQEGPGAPADASVQERIAAAVERLSSAPAAAELLAREAVAQATAAGDLAGIGDAYEVLGQVEFARARHRPAAAAFAEARRAYQRLGMRKRVAAVRLIEVGAHMMLGDRRRALANAAAARRIYQELGDRDGLAKVAVNVGNVYQRCDRGHEAIAQYRQARAHFQARGQSREAAMVALNLANVLTLLDRKDEAEELYREADEGLSAAGRPAQAAQARYNLAYLLYLQGRYRVARDGFASSEEFFAKLGDDLHIALCHLDRSEMWLEVGLFAEAESESQVAVERFATLGMSYEHSRALTFNALARSARGARAGIDEQLAQARRAFVRQGNAVWAATIDVHRARLCLEAGELGRAKRLARAAWNALAGLPLSVKRARAAEVYARVELAAGRTTTARRLLTQAIRAVRNDPSGWTEVRLRLLRARLYGSGKRALGEVDRALALLEDLHASVPPGTWEEALAGDRETAHRQAVELCLEMAWAGGKAEVGRAFLYAERARNRSLLERLSTLLGRSRDGDGAADGVSDGAADEPGRKLLDELTRLRHERWYRTSVGRRLALERTPDVARARRLRREERDLRGQEARLVTRLARNHQRYSGLQDLIARSPESVVDELPPDVCLLEYFVTDRGTAVFQLDSRGIRLHQLPVGREQIRSELHHFQFQMNKYNLGAGYAERHQQVMQAAATARLAELGRLLIADLEPHLDARTLVFAPHDLLHYVPFHALYLGERCLLDDREVTTVPSASLLRLGQRRALHGSSDERSVVIGITDPATPFVEREVESVGRLLPAATVLRDQAATWSAVRREAAHSRYVHIATHGFLRPDSPLSSSLRLWDRWLTYEDAMELDLDADLVVLSACHAGLDRLVSSDEQLGLGRVLLEAGARSLISTLWAVGDESMAHWMEVFYPTLLAGASPLAAFRTACLAARAREPHPHAWAPCVLSGYTARRTG